MLPNTTGGMGEGLVTDSVRLDGLTCNFHASRVKCTNVSVIKTVTVTSEIKC